MAELKVKGWITFEEAAELLGVTLWTVRKYCQRGLLERQRLGCQPLISEKSVKHYNQTRRRGNVRGARDPATGKYAKKEE